MFQVAATVNGVLYSPASPIATPITGSSATPGTTSVPLNGAFDPALAARGVVAVGAIISSLVIGVLVTL